MAGNFKKDDLRIIRTVATLTESLPKLLHSRNFSRLTVNDLCEEAQISRPTFYAHFKDKYQLLEHWLNSLHVVKLGIQKPYEFLESTINSFVRTHTRVIKNLLTDANEETIGIVFDFLLSVFCIPSKSNMHLDDPKQIVFSNFCAGGMLNLLQWQIRNRFPLEFQIMNKHIYEILCTLLKDN